MALGIFQVHGINYEGGWSRLPLIPEYVAADLGLAQPGDEKIHSDKTVYQSFVNRVRSAMRDIGTEAGVTLTDKELSSLLPDATRRNWAINALAADAFYSLGDFIRPGGIGWLFSSPFSPRMIIGDGIVGIGKALEPGVSKSLALKMRPVMSAYHKRHDELKWR